MVDTNLSNDENRFALADQPFANLDSWFLHSPSLPYHDEKMICLFMAPKTPIIIAAKSQSHEENNLIKNDKTK